MELDSGSFWGFLLAALVVVHAVGRDLATRSWCLLALSAVYALSWGRTTLVVLAALVLATAGWLRAIAVQPARKTLWLVLGISTALTPLVAFKYLPPAAAALGAGPVLASMSLPVGLSYVTFSCISHLVEAADETSGRARPWKMRDHLTALLLFPKLVAGPITRANEMLPQLARPPRLADAGLRYGLLLMVVGVTKKHIADLLARVVHDGFDVSSSHLSALEAWIAVLAFAAQLYGEFSGYTDIARGAAELLGIRLPLNFDLPYLARSPVDFWARWHISLSSWLRDYLFLPIAVRGRWAAPAAALLVTMTLGGLWHGASLKFVFWGLYQAALIAGSYALGFGLKRVAPGLARSRLLEPVRVIATFFFMVVGLTLFRAPTASTALTLVGSLFAGAAPSVMTHHTGLVLYMVIGALVVPHAFDAAIGNCAREPATPSAPPVSFRPFAYWSAVATCIVFLILTGGAEAGLPLYARF